MYYLKKIASNLLTVFLLTLVVFALLQFLPGNPVASKLGIKGVANSQRSQQLSQQFQLDLPFAVRYTVWLKKALHGDLGSSFQYENYSVTQLISQRAPTTNLLALGSFILSVIVGFSLGLLLYYRSNKKDYRVLQWITQIGLAIPHFWISLILLLIFALQLRWFPVQGRINWNDLNRLLQSFTLPWIALSIGHSALFARHLDVSLKQEHQREYVNVARTKGLSSTRLYWRHLLPNTLLTMITIMSLSLIDLLTGSIIIENIFSLPGLGSLLVNAIKFGDYPLIQGIILYYSFIIISINLITDITYGILDPRISHRKKYTKQ